MSSDDSISTYSCDFDRPIKATISKGFNNWKLTGENISTGKTLICKQNYGEFTSWFVDGKFTCQYGVETAKLRPSGKNPHDDFNNIAMAAATSLKELKINPFGCETFLYIGWIM